MSDVLNEVSDPLPSQLADLDWPPLDDGVSAREYERYAPIYDALFDDQHDDAEFYLGFAGQRLSPDASILEIGCGTGRLTAHLAAAGYAVCGVDSSAAMLAGATARLAGHPGGWRCAQADVRQMDLGERFDLAVAPYGMVAHLLTDEDRLATFRTLYQHLQPGGWFVYDDRPSWLGPPADPTALEIWRTRLDPETGLPVRLMTSQIEVADRPCTVRYDFLDWLDGERVVRRRVVRMVFRNIALDDELALLRAAGFEQIELSGGFDRRPLDLAQPGDGARLVLCCRRTDE